LTPTLEIYGSIIIACRVI